MKAWTSDHAKADSQFLVNTEEWTLQRSGELTTRGSAGPNSNRAPDFIISLTNELGEVRYFIMDAKYTSSRKAFSHYLPELTMKYLHGLHEKSTGHNLSLGLVVINPDSKCYTRHYHQQRYNIYGSHPVSPALFVSSIAPGEAEARGSDFERNISQILTTAKSRLCNNQTLLAAPFG